MTKIAKAVETIMNQQGGAMVPYQQGQGVAQYQQPVQQPNQMANQMVQYQQPAIPVQPQVIMSQAALPQAQAQQQIPAMVQYHQSDNGMTMPRQGRSDLWMPHLRFINAWNFHPNNNWRLIHLLLATMSTPVHNPKGFAMSCGALVLIVIIVQTFIGKTISVQVPNVSPQQVVEDASEYFPTVDLR